MEYREIGKTGVKVSAIGFGCWTLGGLNWVDGFPNGWADVNEDEVREGLQLALDAGVNHFDNADVYGSGRAERLLARCLKKLGAPREKLVLASKVGHFKGTAEHAYEPAHIRHQCEQSLINLQVDYLDIYYFHHGNFGPADAYLDDAVEVMRSLVREGKVRLVGLSAYSAYDFTRLTPVIEPQVLQGLGNALDDQFIRPHSEVQKLMEQRGLSFVAFSPLAQGRLLDKYHPHKPPQFEPGDHRKDRPNFSGDALAELHARLVKLKQRFGPTTEDLAAVALQYVLAQSHICSVIPGFRNAHQARCNLAGVKRRLSREDVAWIREALHA